MTFIKYGHGSHPSDRSARVYILHPLQPLSALDANGPGPCRLSLGVASKRFPFLSPAPCSDEETRL